jgi:fatty-acyl-CoA synthase
MNKALECQIALQSRFETWPYLTLPLLFDQTAAAHPDRPAIFTKEGNWTYQQLADRSKVLAAAIVASGIPEGSRIAVVMANFAEFICIKLAIARSGCIAVPVNFQLRLDELEYVLDQASCCAIFGMASFRDRDYLPDFAILLDRLEQLNFIVVRDEACYPPARIHTLNEFSARADSRSLAELETRQGSLTANSISDIVYTSGTTGRPKGTMLTHDMLLRSAYSSALTRAFEDGRRILFALPMYHVFGYVECWIAGLFVGGAIIPQAAFDPGEMIDLAEAFDATDIICVPIMTHALISTVRERGIFSAPLRAFFNSGGVNVPTVWDEILDVLGASEIHTAYGMTETTASTMCSRSGEPISILQQTNGQYKLAGAAGSSEIGGRVALYRVVDPVTGKEVAAGDAGELQVKGPVVTKGYYRKPEETAESFTSDGWFRTGDVGKVSSEGYLTLTGRIKETYRCGGEMVMPREIETLLETFPGIAQILVVGVPDQRMGEVGCLCIVPETNGSVDEGKVLTFCREKLARFKVPKYALIFDASEIPLTATGRPQKFELAKLAQEKLKLDHPV